jgi:hypothetical protein
LRDSRRAGILLRPARGNRRSGAPCNYPLALAVTAIGVALTLAGVALLQQNQSSYTQGHIRQVALSLRKSHI